MRVNKQMKSLIDSHEGGIIIAPDLSILPDKERMTMTLLKKRVLNRPFFQYVEAIELPRGRLHHKGIQKHIKVAQTAPDKKKEKMVNKEEKEQQPSKEKNKNLVNKDKKLKPEKKLKDDKIIKDFAKTKKPAKIDEKVMQVSEFEKKELFDPNKIKGLIDKQSEELGQVKKKTKGFTQSDDPTMLSVDKLTISQIDYVKSQYYACWAVPAGLPLNDTFLLTVKLNLKKNGEYEKIDVLERERMGIDKRFKAFADSVIRAIRLCNPLKKLPTATYEKWKVMVLRFSPLEMQGS